MNIQKTDRNYVTLITTINRSISQEKDNNSNQFLSERGRQDKENNWGKASLSIMGETLEQKESEKHTSMTEDKHVT